MNQSKDIVDSIADALVGDHIDLLREVTLLREQLAEAVTHRNAGEHVLLTSIREQRNAAWAEIKELRAAILANKEEATIDEVRRVVAQRDDLLACCEAALWEDSGLSCAGALREAIAKVKGQ